MGSSAGGHFPYSKGCQTLAHDLNSTAAYFCRYSYAVCCVGTQSCSFIYYHPRLLPQQREQLLRRPLAHDAQNLTV